MGPLDLLRHDPGRPLLFNSGAFFFLFSAFIAGHAALARSGRARLLWLLAFSLFYYYRSNGLYVLTLIALASVDWAVALRIHAETSPARRRAWLTLSIASNLG